MEPIVLMGLVIVVYGGYVSLTDFLHGLPGVITFKRRSAKAAAQRERLKPVARQLVKIYV